MAGRHDQDPEERYRTARTVGLGVMVPGMLFGCVVVGCVLGFLVDRWLDSSPWGIVVGLILGSIAGVREMMKLLKKIQKDEK